MALLLTIKILLLTFIISSAATRDTRPCNEKIQGPLYNNSTRLFHTREPDENNTLILRCRVICQEPGAHYVPFIRIITTIDGKDYFRRQNNLFDTTIISPSTDHTCNTGNHIQEYEFLLTVLSDKMNESIAICGLRYSSRSTEYCYVPILAWIILPNQPTVMPPTTTVPPTTTREPTTTDFTTQATTTFTMPPVSSSTDEPDTTTESSTSEDTPTTTEPVVQPHESIPDGIAVSIPFIVIVGLCIVIVPIIIAARFLYKKFAKYPKRKLSSVLPSGEDGSIVIQAHEEDGSTVIQAHGGPGVIKCEDIEENLKFRTSAHN